MKILIEIEADSETVERTLQEVRAFCRIKNAAPNYINGVELKNFKVVGVNCDHPDHNESETCWDRGVGCSKYCKCCMGDSAVTLQ